MERVDQRHRLGLACPEMTDPESLKALGQFAETIGKAYDDLAHPVAAELGKLFSLPFRVVNHYGERLTDMMMKAKDAVPVERQLPASSSIAGRIFENVKYLEDGSPLLAMYQKRIRPALGVVPTAGALVDARARCLDHRLVEQHFGQQSWRRREKAPFRALMSPPSTA